MRKHFAQPGKGRAGCRRSEVLDLRWRDIGQDAIALSDSKTGSRTMPLGEGARALLEALPGARGGRHTRSIAKRGVDD